MPARPAARATIGAGLWRALVFLNLLMVMPLARSDSGRPNLLFMLVDDVSYRNVSCYEGSYPWVSTPHIDRLAGGGMRFTRGYVGVWCMPARATLMTGHHQYGNRSLRLNLARYPSSRFDPDKMPLWPCALRENGYFTGMIGKWHLGKEDGWGTAWDHQKVWNRSRHPRNAHAYYEAQLIETDGGRTERVEGYPTDFYTDWAIDFIGGKTRPADQPWFLWLCYGAAHSPFIPADRDRHLFPGVFVPTPEDVYPPRFGKPDYMQKIQTWTRGKNDRPVLQRLSTPKGSSTGLYGSDLNDWNRQYQQTIAALDDSVGRLMETLRATGQLENTLVVFTADQGFAFGQHGFATKIAPYDANIRPPLIVSRPGTVPGGATCRHPVNGPDLVSTLLAQSGTPEPWDMHGRDISPLLRDPDRKDWDHGTLLAFTGIEWGDRTDHLPRFIKHTRGVPWWVSYSRGPYKYIRTLEENEIEELYDLERDPEELENLAMQPEFHPLVARFREAALDELGRTDAPFLEVLPPVFPLDAAVVEDFNDAGSPFREENAKGRLFPLRRLFEIFTHRNPPENLD